MPVGTESVTPASAWTDPNRFRTSVASIASPGIVPSGGPVRSALITLGT